MNASEAVETVNAQTAEELMKAAERVPKRKTAMKNSAKLEGCGDPTQMILEAQVGANKPFLCGSDRGRVC